MIIREYGPQRERERERRSIDGAYGNAMTRRRYMRSWTSDRVGVSSSLLWVRHFRPWFMHEKSNEGKCLIRSEQMINNRSLSAPNPSSCSRYFTFLMLSKPFPRSRHECPYASLSISRLQRAKYRRIFEGRCSCRESSIGLSACFGT